MVEVDGLTRRPANQDPRTRPSSNANRSRPVPRASAWLDWTEGINRSGWLVLWSVPLSGPWAKALSRGMRLNVSHVLLPALVTLHRPPFTVLSKSSQHLHLSDTPPRLACFGIIIELLRVPSGSQCHGLVGVHLSLVMLVCFVPVVQRPDEPRHAVVPAPTTRLPCHWAMWSERG